MKDSVKDIIEFCFDETSAYQWEATSKTFDENILERFELTYKLAEQGLCEHWKDTIEGTLAYIIILGTLPQYMFRGSHKAYVTLDKAVEAINAFIVKGYDQLLPAHQKKFVYAPLKLSENTEQLEQAVKLYEKIKKEEPVHFKRAMQALEEAVNIRDSVLV